MRHRVALMVLGLLCFGVLSSSHSSQLEPHRMYSYFDPLGAGYLVTITAKDGATYRLDVPDGVLIAVHADVTPIPLPIPDEPLPRTFRGDVTLSFSRIAPNGWKGRTRGEVNTTAPMGVAIEGGTVEIRPRT